MKIYFEQIPEGVNEEDYPEGTEFVMDDTRPIRDSETNKLIAKERRPLLFPYEVK